MANMSAAEVLKAQLNGLSPVKPSAKTSSVHVLKSEPVAEFSADDDMDSVPGLSAFSRQRDLSSSLPPLPVPQLPRSRTPAESDADADGELDPDTKMISTDSEAVTGEVLDILAGVKRKFEEGPGSDEPVEDVIITEEEDDDASPSLTLKVNSDGTAEQEDHVKLV
jgi:5'-3' exoribonuclease 2